MLEVRWFEVPLDVSLKGVFFSGVFGYRREEDFGGVFEVIDEGARGPSG